MSYQLSACVFIRNTFEGAFCVFESMASLLPFVDEFLVMDLGSTDGTLEVLREIDEANPKVRLIQAGFPETDAAAFATLANDLVEMCHQPHVLYCQADEIWHEHLLGLMEERFEQGEFDLSFWRIQYRENFQLVKWSPHLVHRVGHKDNFVFENDGMNTNRTWDAKICTTEFHGGWFGEWGKIVDKEPDRWRDDLPTEEMITDVSLVGAFLENIPQRRALHAPFWHEEPDIEGTPASQWLERERENQNWFKPTSPFDLPHIMRWHVGRPRYELRAELLQALKDDDTLKFLRPGQVEVSGQVVKPEAVKEGWR